MDIFCSWSGPRSKVVAEALAKLLPDIIQEAKVWMSAQDIGAGVRWNAELTKMLERCSFGIICLTPANLYAPWLLFEAGTLSKSVKESRVVPYLLDLRTTDVPFPLAQFQGVETDREGTWSLVCEVNKARNEPMLAERLDRIFRNWWPDFEKLLGSASGTGDATASSRSDRDVLEEILATLRESTVRRRVDWEGTLMEVSSRIARMENLQYRMESSQAAQETAQYKDLSEQLALLENLRKILGELLRLWGSEPTHFPGMA